MNKALPVIALGAAGLLIYWGWTNSVPQDAKKEASPSTGVVGKVIETGSAFGEKARDVFDSIGFGQNE